MEPKTAAQILDPLFKHGLESAQKAEGSPEQLSTLTEAIETLSLCIAFAQSCWDNQFPTWLQFCRDHMIHAPTNRADRRRLEIVK